MGQRYKYRDCPANIRIVGNYAIAYNWLSPTVGVKKGLRYVNSVVKRNRCSVPFLSVLSGCTVLFLFKRNENFVPFYFICKQMHNVLVHVLRVDSVHVYSANEEIAARATSISKERGVLELVACLQLTPTVDVSILLLSYY